MAIYNGRILMRKGNEADFDASKLMSGEWALSTDKGIIRICLEAGKVIRMATYEAFEEDMKQIEAILLECQSIEEAVRRINTEVSEKLNACAEYVQQAKGYSEQAKTSEANAKSYMQSAKTSEENAKVSETNAKASENSAKEYENSAKLTEERAREVFESIPEDYSTISNDLYELAIKETASGEEIHVNDSANVKLREFALFGKARQDGEPTPENPQPIEVSGASGSVTVKSWGKNLWNPLSKATNQHGQERSGIVVKNGTYTITNNSNTTVYCRDGINSTVTLGTVDPQYSSTFNFKSEGVLWLSNTNNISDIQVEEGEGTPFEPYKETLATIPTPNGLASVNDARDVIVKYADGSGEHIQRVKNILLDGVNNKMQKYSSGTHYFIKLSDAMKIVTENQSTLVGVISDRYIARTWIGVSLDSIKKTGIALMWGNGIGIYDSNYANSSETDFNAFLAENPVNVYYLLAEPIHTPLTAEEIAEIEKLHTFYPVTNISNDADCGMSVTYYADSKNYIGNQLAIMKQEQEEAMANMLLLMPTEVQSMMIENDTNNLLTESEI